MIAVSYDSRMTNYMFDHPQYWSLTGYWQDDGFGEAIKVEGESANYSALLFIEEDLH